MTTPELLALAIGLSVGLAGLGFGGVRLLERGVADPRLRQRAWTTALYLPVLPILLVGVLLAGPRPVIEAPAGQPGAIMVQMDGIASPAPSRIDTERLAIGLLALATLLTLMRGMGLAVRTVRLRRLMASTTPAGPALLRLVEATAGRTGVPLPAVRVCGSSGDAMVTGVRRPVLIVPSRLADDPVSPEVQSVCAHELVHLKRGDHRALWLEEALLTLLAVNPVLKPIRDHLAAAREEACDAQVLADADADVDQRRVYARSLLDALRSPAGGDVPALTFTSSRRIFAMHRLKAILTPAPVAGVRARLAVLGLGVAIATVAGAGSFALAAQRQPVSAPRVTATAAAAVVAAPVAALPPPAVVPVAVPETRVSPAGLAEAAEAPLASVEAAPVAVATAPPAQEPITNPGWVERPTPSWPSAALEAGITGGVVTLSCLAQADGRLADCQIVSEDPVGAGFGPAALEAAQRARLSPRTVEAMATRGRVQFNVRMQMAE